MLRSKLMIISITVVLLAGCSQATAALPTEVDNIATIVAATLTSFPSAVVVLPTETVLATETPIPPTSTPTQTANPTETLTPIPSQTATIAIGPDDPKAYLGKAAWQASFNDDSNWYTFETEQTRIVIEDGKLILKSLKANGYENWSMSWPILTDYYLEITATFGETCQGKDRVGLISRAPNPNKGYLFGISCDGSYRVRKWDGEKFTELSGWKSSGHINSGPSQVNRIGFMAEGTKISVFANGHLLTEVEDDVYDKGAFGVFIAASDTPGFTAFVSQAAYWDIP